MAISHESHVFLKLPRDTEFGSFLYSLMLSRATLCCSFSPQTDRRFHRTRWCFGNNQNNKTWQFYPFLFTIITDFQEKESLCQTELETSPNCGQINSRLFLQSSEWSGDTSAPGTQDDTWTMSPWRPPRTAHTRPLLPKCPHAGSAKLWDMVRDFCSALTWKRKVTCSFKSSR